MGGRKSSRSQLQKKSGKPKLETSFPCPYCNEENSVECKLDRAKQTGMAHCRACQAGYQTMIDYLSDPVDIFAEWVDAIDTQTKQKEALKQRAAKRRKEKDEDDGHHHVQTTVEEDEHDDPDTFSFKQQKQKNRIPIQDSSESEKDFFDNSKGEEEEEEEEDQEEDE